MGRTLEALKRSEEPKPIQEPAVSVPRSAPPQEEDSAVDMPFIEVGEPRKPVEAKLRLETPAPRSASLQVWAPQAVELQSCPLPTKPRGRVAAELIAFHQPTHPVSQQYAELFAQIVAERGDEVAPVLLLTALSAGAGTTTSVLNLAIAGCKKHHKRICVVDANHLRSTVATRLGLTANAGVQEVLNGKVALENAVHTTSIDGLFILPFGAAMTAPLGNADAIRWILDWLRQRFDLVLVDAPAWEGGAVTQTLLPATNAVYLVVDATETEKPAVRMLTRDVARLGSRLDGLIVAK